jgi:hypothetical protein
MHFPSNFSILSLIDYAKDDVFMKGIKSIVENEKLLLNSDIDGNLLIKLQKNQLFKSKNLFGELLVENDKSIHINQSDFKIMLKDKSKWITQLLENNWVNQQLPVLDGSIDDPKLFGVIKK